ncbi:hypothetical protein TRIATDRAFT_83393 [Trichoderma atroviride IMI 206040]|uniref:Telomeric single stranded DNA binding POT1/Cdc13 domain-containing protein n=1 Tax=Hypocrea atroviridis (strain ATCC 20476 / IMI 206040) TaxID=452589 RepID=G9NFF4_HYPAI|nr:uncharacterized protein TRIATDRAFT_83393 [Trichoderma atroviride IMI 206040]EHK50670.1 hypothetical protein TRIATDRAFT_83393 [Trichoderma atroviride IMI 206040]
MAKDDAQLDVLRSTEATPIAKLSPAILDAEALVIEGVITVTWPYSAVTKSIAFILAERDPLHRRDKGQLRVEFQGAAAKALADAHLGGGDEVRLSLDGVRWEENQAWMRRPGTLEWQMKFTNRLLLMIRRAENQDVDTISINVDDGEGDQESIEQPQTMSPSPSVEIEQTHFANPVPRTPLSVVPSKRYAYETLGPGEYTSPAFIKRARVSYGSLFEGGFDIFDEEEPPRSAKKKKKRRSLFNMNPTSWRYASRSPSPEAEEQPTEDEEQDEPTIANTETIMLEDREGAKETEKGDQLPAVQPQPVMVDHGCQTREMSSSPVSGVQIIAESKSTGILLQPTPTNPWKHPDMGRVLQQPSPLSFEAHDARARVHESEPIRQPEIPAPHSGFDMSMSIDPSLQSHEADVHHHQHSYNMMAAEMQPPPLQEHEAPSSQTHDGLAWVADTLAAAYHTMPTHDVHGFPQGSFARSSYTLRASPSDETHTLASAGYHGVGMHGYVQVNEAHTMLSSSFTQSGVEKPNPSYHGRREDDTETATVTATFGREGRSSPPQQDSSTDESQEEAEEDAQRGFYDWNRQNGDPEEAYDDEQYADQGSGEDEINEDDITESELEESGSDADYESGSEYEYESESRIHNEAAQPALYIPRPFIPIPRPAPAASKEPVVISLLSDSEDDDSDKPTAAVQAKKEQSEEPIPPEQYEANEQPSEQEDEVMDEDEDEDEDDDQDGYEDEDEEGAGVDESLDENMDEIEDASDIEEVTEIKPVVSQSSKRPSMVSQLDGSNEVALLQHDEPDRSEISPFEMDHPNLILSPKSDKRRYVNIAETIAEAEDTVLLVSSPLADRTSPQPESVIANADNEEITTDIGMGSISKSRSPEPINTEKPTSLDSGESAAEPSVHKLEIPADMAEVEETSILQSTTNDDQLMEDVDPVGLEIQPTSAESKTEDDDVAEPDMEMQDDLLNQLGKEAENVEIDLEKEIDQIDQATEEISPITTGELEVVASSPPPVTLTALSSMTPMAVPALDEQAATKQLSIPLEAREDDHEVYHDVADTVVTEEVPLAVDESVRTVDEDVDEPVYHDVEEDLEEDIQEDDAREDGSDDNGDDDDTAIEQQLMAESQHYSTPQKAHDAPALSQPLEAIEETHECNHAHHHHAHHHHDHHTEQSAHERGSRRAEPEMLITVQSLRSHCRAKRVSSGSSDSFLIDPNASFAKGSPNKASQCLIGDEESLPQRSPRSSRSSPRSKAEPSVGNAALAKSSFQESKSPKEAGAPTSLRARRGVKGPTDASILLAQALSEPSERSPQQLNSPTESLRASRHKSDQPDPSSQLTAETSKDSQQQLEQENPQDAAYDASATPRRDVTPESTATGHNLRSPRKLAAGRPSSATSSVAEDVSITSLRLQLTKSLRTSLPDYLPLKFLRASLNKTADILAVVTATPREPHRPKSGPRDYMLELNLTDPSAAPTTVIIAHIFRPHKFTLPAVQAGDIVLLRRVQVVSMQGRGFGVRAGDASAWAVYEKDSKEMLPQIKGPPVEITNEEVEYVQGLKRWWSLQDDKSLAKIDKANQRMSQGGKDDTK